MADWSENALTLLCKRYLRWVDKATPCSRCHQQHETPDEMLRRVSFGVPEFYEIMDRLEFLPNSPTLFSAGTDSGCLSACHHLNINDTTASIMDVARKSALCQKWGGGVGFTLSSLRAEGAPISSTHGKACGPISVLKMLHSVGKMVTQAGRRNSAQLALLDCYHPDIRQYIHCKDENPEELNTFNISVAITDEFMRNVNSGRVEESKLFKEICESAWKTGDPGLFFIDTVERHNLTPWAGQLSGCNPCWRGDTKVWTIYGPKRFDEITEDVPVLTQLEDGTLVYRMMRNVHCTSKNAPILRITIEPNTNKKERGQSVIYLTPTHQLYLSDGSKIMARDLMPGDRLQSVYRHKANSKGYLQLTNGIERVMEHHVVLSWGYGRRPNYPSEHADHIDGNKTNNSPDNLRILPASIHNALKMWGDKNPLRRFPERNPVKLYPGLVAGEKNGRYGKPVSEETRQKISQSNIKHGKYSKYNHVVVAIEEAEPADVYNGTVDETHNYFVVTEDMLKAGGILSANCGESPLRDNESCNLGSINLAKFVSDKSIDWDNLRDTVRVAVRFLDRILDENMFPVDEIMMATLDTRKLGLGVMGWADMLALMQIQYDSSEAVHIAEDVMRTIQETAHNESAKLAVEKGFAPVYINKSAGKRNATLTCIAPTGSISILAGCSSGIEPHYSLSWIRTMGDGTILQERIPVIDKCGGFVPKTAMDISWYWHVKHQAAFQKWTDLAVSKTINMPNNATVKDIEEAFQLMWELGCKGGTIYRDGCREQQVLSTQTVAQPEQQIKRLRKKLADERLAITRKFQVSDMEGYITVGLYEDGKPGEVFLNVSKEGSTVSGLLDTTAILVSMALQHGVPMNDLVRKLSGVRFEPAGLTNDKDIPIVSSIIDYVFRWLDKRFNVESPIAFINQGDVGSVCVDCGGLLIAQSGCLFCPSCGWEKCG